MQVIETGLDFSRDGLEISDLDTNPFHQFEKWYGEAMEDGVSIPNAMSLATADANGEPSLRTVLLKLYDEQGFVFFTNYGSAKAHQIAENPNVALLFPWVQSGRQVKVRGSVAKVSTAESLSYFLSRPRGSQLGAWSSDQSQIINSRAILEKSVQQITERFKNREVPLPDFWGGYRVSPVSIEFWQARQSRLHDRFMYQKSGDSWAIDRLSP